jgi:hypothetical protein
VWFENRRVIDVLRGIESAALRIREHKHIDVTMDLDGSAPAIRLPMERPLYVPVRKARIDSDDVRPADEQTDPTTLFEQIYVDPEPLRGCVRRALQRGSQIGLTELLNSQPLEQGLAELVTYLSLTDETFAVVFDEGRREQVSWTEPNGRSRTATLPGVTFARTGSPKRGSAN